MQNGRLTDVVAVDKGQGIGVQRGHRAHSLQQRDEAVPRLDRGSEELQAVRVRRSHLHGIAAQLDPSPAIAAVGHLHQDGTLAVAGYVVGPIGRPQWLLLSSPGL